MKKTILFLIAFIFLSAGWAAVSGQSPAALSPAPNRVAPAAIAYGSFELESKLMARKIPYRFLLPLDYNFDKTKRFPVLYLLHGLGGSYKDWTEKTKLLQLAMRHQMIIITVEGGNGWYTDSATKTADKYESYIVQELIPEIDKKFRTIAERKGRAVAGLSMGGYGAIKFGLKYPEKFVFAASMSGAVSVASWKTIDQLPPTLRQMIVATFGDESSDVKKANDLSQIFSELSGEQVKSLPFFYLDCGTEDEFELLAPNQQLAALLLKKNVQHEFRQLPGQHNWIFWDQQIKDVLQISERMFASQKSNVADASAN